MKELIIKFQSILVVHLNMKPEQKMHVICAIMNLETMIFEAAYRNEHISSSESLSLTSKQTVICGVCSKVFENVKECQNHVGNHHENGK